MEKFIYFSQYINPIKEKIKFSLIVILRFLKVLFRRKKSIHLSQLDFARKYHFDSSYLIIRYQFKNALWYNFKGLKKTTDREVIILNFNKITSFPIELIVHGFFRKEKYVIYAMPEKTLRNGSFKTTINGISDLSLHIKTIDCSPKPMQVIVRKPPIKEQSITIEHPEIQLHFSPYTQTDFI